MIRPKLRPLQVNFSNGYLILSDPFGITPHAVSLSPAAALVVSLMDGKRTVEEIAESYAQLTKELITPTDIMLLIEKLDRWYLLDNDRFKEIYSKLSGEFLDKGIRPYVFAGESYPKDPMALKEMVSPARRREQADRTFKASGVVIPHIDPRRGWEVYIEGLRVMYENPADLYIIFGVAHSPTRHPVQLLPMDLDTPLGRLKLEREMANELVSRASFDLSSDPLAFANEHSIEFPAVFIKALFPERDMKVLPLIVSDLDWGVKAIDELVSLIREFTSDRKVMYVAAVDLSHTGPRFGDRYFDENRTRYYDGEFMKAFSSGDPEALLNLYRETGNPTSIDAFGATYALMRAVGGGEGTILKYAISYEEETGSAVSFMSGVLSKIT